MVSPTRRPLRLGMIGCGQISTRFFNQAEALDALGWDVRFVATCARTEASARAKAEERHCARWYTDHRRLLDDPEVDAVVIATPHALHASQAADAARAGKHILVEKPMTTRWDDALALQATVEASGVTCMALPYVDTPAFLKALEYANDAYLGKITGVEAELSFGGPPRSNWYYDASAEGGAMLDTMVYPLARVAALMGPAKRLVSRVNRLIPQRLTGDGGRVESQVDDQVSVVLEYESGQQGIVHSIWTRSYMTNGTVLHGRHGAIFLGRYGQPLVVKSDRQAPPDGTPVEYLGIPNCFTVPVPAGEVTGEIVAHFVQAVRGEVALHCGLDVGMHLAEQTMGAYESAKTGEAVELHTTFTPWWGRATDAMTLSDGWY
ncbi:MAG: Gfo/Idh/MocA family protein [Chloroflexota bacterium]|jgi:predicted dehydrogenase|nr:Gfo/Idh/MocA family oxidoreductase [Chloroflexota bacterium]